MPPEELETNEVEREKTTPRIRGTLMDVEVAAQNLRRNMTPAERVLWQAIRQQQLDGLRFRRQHPVGPYVLDFFCPSHRLVIELDGEIHDQQLEMDAARTEHLNRYGYHVLRFRNSEVYSDLNGVLERIRNAARAIERSRDTPEQPGPTAFSPPPALGEGPGVGA